MEEDNPLGLGYTPTFGDAIQGIVDYGGAVARFYQKGIPQFLTGVRRGIKEEAEAPSPITDTRNPIQAAGELTTAYSQAESAALEKVASGVEALGLPEPVAGAAALAVSPFIPGPAEIGLISKGGTAMMGLTVTDPRFIAKGVRQGIAETEEFAPGVQTLRGLAADVKAKQTGYLQQFEAGDLTDKQLTERFGKLKKRSDAKYSTLATPDDPDIFEVPSQRNLDPTNVDEFAHQHHVAPKSMTTPWVKKALEIGDDDDVVALFMLHKQLLGSGMGNVRTGMLDMPGPTHIAREARTELEKASNVHTMFKKGGADIEIPTKQVEKIIGDPKTMDELLDKYTTFMAERLVPMKELSIKRMNQFLAEHRSKLSSSEIEAFDKMVQKLNMAGQ
jgi:hypothetical protein